MGALAPAILRKNCYFKYCIKKLLEIWKNYINAQHPQYQNPNEASRFINGVGLYFGLYARLRTSKEMDGTHNTRSHFLKLQLRARLQAS